MVLKTLRHHQLYAKASKCEFGRSSVGFLGHIISARGVAVDPRKIDAIRAWARPVSCTDVRRFVGLSNYYRKFVKGFANLAAPLTSLCSPKAKFRWTAVEQRSFEQLQAALMSAPVLRVWDPARPTRLITDASELAVSAILEQPDDAGAWHPVAYESRKLIAPERAYPPHLLELLAVVHALKVLRPYLLDRPFELHKDNASLQWFQQQRHVTHQQARWLNTLAEFRMKVVHIPGRTNPADFLTRKASPRGWIRRLRRVTRIPRALSSSSCSMVLLPPRRRPRVRCLSIAGTLGRTPQASFTSRLHKPSLPLSITILFWVPLRPQHVRWPGASSTAAGTRSL